MQHCINTRLSAGLMLTITSQVSPKKHPSVFSCFLAAIFVIKVFYFCKKKLLLKLTAKILQKYKPRFLMIPREILNIYGRVDFFLVFT